MDIKTGIKKSNVFVIVLLSHFTMGIYVPYWFIARRKSFEELEERHINYGILKILMAVYALLFIYNIVDTALFTDYGKAILDSVDLIVTFFGLGIMYFSVFRVKEVIEDDVSEKIFNPWLLIFFHIWYLQYKINRLDGEGNAKRYNQKAMA